MMRKYNKYYRFCECLDKAPDGGYWWWTKLEDGSTGWYNDSNRPDSYERYTNYSDRIHTAKAFRKWLQRWQYQVPRGTKFRLISRFIGLPDIVGTVGSTKLRYEYLKF